MQVQTHPKHLAFRQLFESPGFQSALKNVMPRSLDPKRMARVVLAALQNQPKLYECSPESVVLSVMRAAAYGLEPDGGPMGHGYLVPYWSGKNRRHECQFIPGYRGLMKMARNSGEVADIWAEVVRTNDHFNYELGLNPTLTHKRDDDSFTVGELKYAYAVARFRDGERKFVVMNKAEIEAVKERSQSRDRDKKLVGPWVEHEAEMWKKTAVRRLAKMLPLDVESRAVIEQDDDEDDLGDSVSDAIPQSIDIPAALAAPPESDEQGDDEQPADEAPKASKGRAPKDLLPDDGPPDDVAEAMAAEGIS